MARGAVKLVIEPIFEADLDASAHGYRPKRSAGEPVQGERGSAQGEGPRAAAARQPGTLAPGVRDRLDRVLRGWSHHFGYGTRMPAYRAVDNYVHERVRHFLVRRHKVPSRGTARFCDRTVFAELGVPRPRRVHLGSPPCASR